MDEATLAHEYHVLEELGSGSFGIVYKGIEKTTGQYVAIKHIDLESSEDDIQDIQQEISLLSTCDSPFVTRYKSSFLKGHKLWIVMEYMGGGSCLDLLKLGVLEECHVAIICRELLLGLQYLHSEGKIHRDIKAANVLLSQKGEVKLADFGVAAQLSNIKSQRNTFVGTPFWMAPEVIQQAGYDFKADIWSLGITAVELLKGEPPHADIHPMKALFLIPKAPAPRLLGDEFSAELKDFISVCLVKDPTSRPTAKELLKHHFIRKAGSVQVLSGLLETRYKQAIEPCEDRSAKLYEETMRPLQMAQLEDDPWIFDTIKKLPLPNIVELGDSTARTVPVASSTSGLLHKPVSILEDKPESGHLNQYREVTMTRRHSLHQGPPESQVLSSLTESRMPLGKSRDQGNAALITNTMKRYEKQRESVDSLSASAKPPSSIKEPAREKSSGKVRGKLAFSAAVLPALEDLLASTTSQSKRDLLSKFTNMWQLMSDVDAEGNLLLLESIVRNLHSNPSLSTILPSTIQQTDRRVSKPKLMLASSNPHLKSHRRRESLTADALNVSNVSKASRIETESSGMEHTRRLTESLYNKWLGGLRTRWPILS